MIDDHQLAHTHTHTAGDNGTCSLNYVPEHAVQCDMIRRNIPMFSRHLPGRLQQSGSVTPHRVSRS